VSFTLDRVVPWGRSFAEYAAMFALTDTDLRGRILGAGDGPAAFNAELTRRGGRVVSVDPLYQYPAAAIRARIDAVFPAVMAETERNRDEFVWTTIGSPKELARLRRSAMETFLADYAARGTASRYVAGALPHLPFADGAFDCALCSHYLFLYSEQLTADDHAAALRELARVAREVRVFPLLELGARPSRHLPAVLDRLTAAGHAIEYITVPYEFQRGGNRMLRLHR